MVVDRHGCHTALHDSAQAKENQDRVPTLYWLPKLHKNIKQDLLLILVINYCEKVYERSSKMFLGLLEI